MWGDDKNRRQRLTLFCSFLSLFIGLAIFIPVVKNNWNGIVNYVKAEIFKIEKNERNSNKKPAIDETVEIPIEPDEPDVPIEPDIPDEPDIPIEPDIPDEPDVPTEPEDPEIPDEPETPEDPDIPVEPEDPETPVEPDIPVEPEDPDVPTEPEDPDEHIDPDIPTEPEEPETPVEPEDPDVPTEPDEPDVPTEPDKPDVPIEPEEPVEPETPDTPTEPEEPETPEDPENPVEPEDPDEPIDPDIPTEPENPVEPDIPDEPDVPTEPEDPETPVEPETPTEPDEPVEPEDPDVPTEPEDPDEPIDPDIPTEPENPETPEEPDEPETPEEPVLSPEQIAFNSMTERLQKLEDLAIEYYSDESTARLQFLRYLRSKVYNDTSWKTIGGEADASFAEYVTANQGEYNLTKFSNFVIPSTNETVDFYHLFAVLNVTYLGNQGNSDLSGWGGDLIQFMGQFKNTSLTGNELIEAVRSSFNSSSSTFGSADVCADFDAVNIINLYNNSSNVSITDCIINYYTNITTAERITKFKSNAFSNNCTEDIVLNRLKNNLLISVLAWKEGATLNKNNAVCMACIKVFVEYVNQTV